MKDVNKYITILNYYIKIKLDEEIELTKEEKSKLSNVNKNFEKGEYNIVYRFKSRNSYFITKNKNIFRIDLTSVKQAYNINNIEDIKLVNESVRYEFMDKHNLYFVSVILSEKDILEFIKNINDYDYFYKFLLLYPIYQYHIKIQYKVSF